MLKQNKRILIAVPCRNDIEGDTFKSIYDQIIPPGYETSFHYFYGYAVDQVRNLIAHRAIEWGFDYVFCVDHDITFPSDTLKKLLEANKDIVSGVYRQRVETSIELELFDYDLKRYPNIPVNNALIQVGACGFGCVLVKTEVFKKVGYPYFSYTQAIDHTDSVSEDVDFCCKARITGSEVWADTSILCGHIGRIVFNVPKFDSQARFRELSNQALLPYKHIQYLQNMNINPKVVYDIGACVLHWTREARDIWPNARFIAFEAMNGVEGLYREHGIEFCTGDVLAGSTGDVVDFYENVEHPGGNSIFKENPQLSPMAVEIFSKPPVKKYTVKLDDLVAKLNIPLPDLIKIDVQGSELYVLSGALETLKDCKDIIIEMQHKDYNIGAPKYNEVKSYLEGLGFYQVGDAFCKSSLGVDADYHFSKNLS